MREYRQIYGKYKGTYVVYENPEECKKETGITPKRWLEDTDIKEGDWIEALDGYVCQCLNVYKMQQKRYPQFKTIIYRFPMSQIYRSITPRGEKWNNFYAMYTFPQKGRITNRGERERSITYKLKEVFVKLILEEGLSVEKAYAVVDNYKTYRSKASVRYHSRTLLEDKQVREIMAENLRKTPFFEKLDSELTDEDLINQVVDLVKNSKKGSKDHRENIVFAMKMKGHSLETLPSDQNKLKPHENAEEADFEDIKNEAPPTKGKDDASEFE